MQLDLEAVATVDFETYFDKEYSLRSKDMNLSEYVRDDRFLAHCVSIKLGSAPTQIYWYDEIKPTIEAIDWTRYHLLAHNTAFDGFIMSQHYKVVPPNPTLTPLQLELGTPIPRYYLDTMSMARALHSNQTWANLDDLCTFYGMPGKNPRILSKMKGLRDIPQEIRDEASAYCIGDVDKCFAIFSRMIGAYPAKEIELIDWTIRQFADPVLFVDLERATAERDRQAAHRQALMDGTGLTEDQLQSSSKLAEQLRALGVEPPMKESPRTGLQTFAFSQSDGEFMELLLHEKEEVRNLIAGRLAARSVVFTTRAERFINVGARPLPVGLNYYGAHTGRWSGANKMNLQNLPKEEKDDDGNAIPETGELRKSIVAPPGHVIVVADSAQIECRVLAWLAGQSDLLELFRVGGDPYCELASEAYGEIVTKANRDKRAVGKAGVLGLGFYMGARRFRGSLAAGILGPKVELDEEFCQKVVATYRRKNAKIAQLWKDLGVLIENLFWKENTSSALAYSTVELGGGVKLAFTRGTVWLPSGLSLSYPRMECHESADARAEYTFRTNRDSSRLHSGILTENLVQALARIIIAHQLLRINRRYRVVMMTHDELVCLAPEHEADACLELMLTEMATPPKWCSALPLKAEGGYDRCYSK